MSPARWRARLSCLYFSISGSIAAGPVEFYKKSVQLPDPGSCTSHKPEMSTSGWPAAEDVFCWAVANPHSSDPARKMAIGHL
jgi:hypothetical protein